MSDYETFYNNDDLFDRIQLTHQDIKIIWKFISNKPNENESPCEAIEICDDKIKNKKRIISKKIPKHTLQRKRKKIPFDYRD